MFRVKNIILTASLGLMPLLSLAQTRLLIPDTLSGTSISLNLQNITHNHGGHSMKNMDDMSAKLISSKAQKELAGIFDAYLIIKNDLVRDDFSKGKESLEQYKLILSQINISLFKGDNHTLWMKHSTTLEKLTKRFIEAKDIADARELFILISEQMIMIAKAFPPYKELYIQYCPMADRNNGARWLSDSKIVKNPYFGESMLKCGEVKGPIK